MVTGPDGTVAEPDAAYVCCAGPSTEHSGGTCWAVQGQCEDELRLEQSECDDGQRPDHVADEVPTPLCVHPPKDLQKYHLQDVAEVVRGREVEEAVLAGFGEQCGTAPQPACHKGFVCSTSSGTCKYAPMEKCTTSNFWQATNCAQRTFGNGHQFECHTHETLGGKRCCIKSQSKHWGSEEDAVQNRRPLQLGRYKQRFPESDGTLADGKQFSLRETTEPLPEHKGYRLTGRMFHRKRVGGYWTTPPSATLIRESCCSGRMTYGREGVVGDSLAERIWQCQDWD